MTNDIKKAIEEESKDKSPDRVYLVKIPISLDGEYPLGEEDELTLALLPYSSFKECHVLEWQPINK